MTLKPIVLIAAIVAGLSACSPTVRMHAASVTQFADGTEWVMTGDIRADIERSSLTRLSGGGVDCEMPMEMRLDRSGQGVMTCRDQSGTVLYSEEHIIPAGVYGTALRGTIVDTIDTPMGRARLAFGWGNMADPDQLRRLLQ